MFDSLSLQAIRSARIVPAAIVLLCLAGPLQAKLKDFVKVDKIKKGRFDFGLWAFGDGAQSRSTTICVASSNYDDKFKDPPPVKDPPAVHEPYRFKVRDRNPPTGYYMYLDNDATNTGNARLSIQIQHRDVKDGNSWETLADDVYDSHAHKGQFNKCKNGRNSDIRITISQAELEQARAGRYRASLDAIAIGGSSGTKTARRKFRASIEISNIVRITGLADIPLGTYAGGGDINREEGFCVYSNNSTAAYEVTITSPNQDAAANFYLVNADASASIAYTLYFKDNLSPGVGRKVGTLPLSGNGNNSASDCGGADNARLSVNVLRTEMDVVPADSYSDTLTVLVAPL